MKTFNGTVLRATTPKTVFVEVKSYWMHPVYRKKRTTTTVFACHDAIGVKVGDEVRIGETRPMSKTKRFIVLGDGKEEKVEKVTETKSEVKKTVKKVEKKKESK